MVMPRQKRHPAHQRMWQRVLASGRRVDPYLIWAAITGGKGLGEPVDRNRPFQIAASLEDGVSEVERSDLRKLGFNIEPKSKARHVTALLSLWDFVHVLGRPSIERVELCLPRAGDTGLNIEGGRSKPLTGLVVAVIDDFCAFAHRAFRHWGADGRWHTRVQYLWDQGAVAPRGGWTQPKDFAYGLQADSANFGGTLDAALQSATRVDGTVDEQRCYVEAGLAEQIPGVLAHGTHVLDLAAGAPDPLASVGFGVADDAAAAEARIIFVQLPKATVLDTSGASMSLFVIDALRYILHRVDPAHSQLVVNLSYGTMAGPHDGTSILERAMEDMLSERKDFAIVLPAGNFYTKRCHACVVLGPRQRSARLGVQVRADDPTDTFIELWWMGSTDDHPTPKFTVCVKPAGGAPPSPNIASGQMVGWDGQSGHWEDLPGPFEPACGVIRYSPTALTDGNSQMALLALAPSKRGATDRPLAPHGVWEVILELEPEERGSLAIEAWIERDDQSLGSGRSRSQAFFRDASGEDTDAEDTVGAPVSRAMTLSSSAHGQSTVVVGGCLLRGNELSDYSSSGPGRADMRVLGPDLVAPCDESLTVKGLLAAGARSESPVRMNGTSVAAPVVARRLADILAARRQTGQPPADAATLKAALLAEVEPASPDRPDDADLPCRRGAGRLRPQR
jgi:hypothetical protein